jgi:O-antigen ligase
MRRRVVQIKVYNNKLACPQVRRIDMQKSRLIVGLILIAAAVMMFVFGTGSYSTAGVIALLVIGLASIASSRRK